MTMSARPHTPVLLHEVIAALVPKDGGVYVDGTFGRGGYARALLEAAKTRVFGIDRDPEAIAAGQRLAEEFKPRLTLLHGPFGAMDILLAGEQMRRVDGVALDLGMSSPQIDNPERGFSFMADGPLDMRMGQSGPSAADIVNECDENELADIIFRYGEERYSRRVAKRIVEARAERRITRTKELAEIARGAVPRSADGIDPATRTFQALRIHVNDELGELRRGLEAAETLLKPQGRLAVVSFHSLEDRVVKDFLRRRSTTHSGTSRHLPANDRGMPAPSFHLLTRKPQTPTAEESRANPRARSAKLRIAERTDAPHFAPGTKENAA
jgi:16S rRNA (cytosine1402-N4)-methyltransferase